ncbi:hypothetical protein COL8621_00699 [Actibacterium lipolyticum]|uniref:Uncharacterized protein n=1 Tax=Actibacterium lipolyticum TaxID=1524263 RepID=A0A238JPE9_9RHOB|nr:hypothetical protein COL8621_00699 [Actibacterium lipolyticum]
MRRITARLGKLWPKLTADQAKLIAQIKFPCC